MKIPIGQNKLNIDIRVHGQEVRDDGQHVHMAEQQRRRQHQIAARGDVFAGRGFFELLDIFHDALGRFDLALARIRQGEFARGTMQQLCAEVGFQFAHLPAAVRLPFSTVSNTIVIASNLSTDSSSR